jgi:hypothetical protein
MSQALLETDFAQSIEKSSFFRQWMDCELVTRRSDAYSWVEILARLLAAPSFFYNVLEVYWNNKESL